MRVESRRWEPVHRGVYQTRPGRQDWWTRATAAFLARGPQSAWSHGTAAFAWGIGPQPRYVDLVVPRNASVRSVDSAEVRLHRSAFVTERVHDHMWPWRTTAEDTILDVGGRGTLDDQLAVLARAFQKGVVTDWTVAACLDRRGTHRWRTVLVDLLGEVATGSESPLEVRFVRDVLRPHGLPVGTRQMVRFDRTDPTRPHLHDLGYPDQRVLVELDGRLGHEGYLGRLKDGVRDRRGLAAGWVTLRAFWLDVAGRPCGLAAEVGDVLRSRGWTGDIRACRSRTCAVRLPALSSRPRA